MRIPLVPYPNQRRRCPRCPQHPWCWRGLRRICLPFPPVCSSGALCPSSQLDSSSSRSIRGCRLGGGDARASPGSQPLQILVHLDKVQERRGADICVTLGHLPPTWCLVCSVGLGRWHIGFLSSTLQGRAGLQVSLLSPLLTPPPQCC